MTKRAILLWSTLVVLTSCGSKSIRTSHAVQGDEQLLDDEIIELNWSRAVKDLYFFDGGDDEVIKVSEVSLKEKWK